MLHCFFVSIPIVDERCHAGSSIVTEDVPASVKHGIFKVVSNSIGVFCDSFVFAGKSSKADVAVASLLHHVSAGSMIGTIDQSFQAIALVLKMRTKVGRWILATLSTVQMLIVKGRGTVAMELQFHRSIHLDGIGSDAGTAIETNIAIIATGGVICLLFFEAMDVTELAGPTIGAVTAVFGVVKITADTTMHTKKDTLERIGIGWRGAETRRLVLARRARIGMIVIHRFRTIADLFGSRRATF
jgi:hypothetical protein